MLGSHVKQAGSLVAPDRLRFDFVHFSPIPREQLDEIERIVNSQVFVNTPVQTDVKRTDEAIAGGAMALFGEKYGDTVRVVSVPGFSMELCGGTHCRATGDIGPFTIVAEGGVAAGVRRIEAVTGEGAVQTIQQRTSSLNRILHALATTDDHAVGVVEKLQAEVKRLHKEVSELKVQAAMGGGVAVPDDSVEVAGIRMVTRKVSGLDKAGLRSLSDSLRDQIGSGVVVLANAEADKVTLVVAVTKDLTKRVQAGAVVRQIAPIVGGGGGGRPDFAEAGGRDVSKIDAALTESRNVVEKLLAGQ